MFVFVRARFHARHGFFGGQINRLHVDGKDAVELVFGQALKGLRQVAHTGVVDEDVEAAKVQLRSVHHGGHIGCHADINTQRAGGGADAGGHVKRGLQVHVGHQHLRTFGDKFAHDARAKTRARAGDDGDFVLESHGWIPIKLVNGLRFLKR